MNLRNDDAMLTIFKEALMKRMWIFLIILFFPSVSYAYYETHPPYKFKQGPYRHVPNKPLPDKDVPIFIKKTIDPIFLHPDIYQIDVDGNGTQDFIIFLYPGVGTLLNEVHIFLKKPDSGYQEISFSEDGGAGIEDVVDINNNGKWEIILTDLYGGKKHNYISYSVYEFKDYRLVNVDTKFKGFPKFVLFTDKSNDMDTTHLTVGERQKHVQEKDSEISYQEIK